MLLSLQCVQYYWQNFECLFLCTEPQLFAGYFTGVMHTMWRERGGGGKILKGNVEYW